MYCFIVALLYAILTVPYASESMPAYPPSYQYYICFFRRNRFYFFNIIYFGIECEIE